MHRIVYQQNVLAFLDYDHSYDRNTAIVLATDVSFPGYVWLCLAAYSFLKPVESNSKGGIWQLDDKNKL